MAWDTYWGVDSYNPATHKVPVKGSPTLFHYLTDQCGQMPDFWGRYLFGPQTLQAGEADYIFKESNGNCRILIIYNGASNSKSSTQGGFKEGQRDAAAAAIKARSLGVPAGVMLYVDIEPNWKCTPEWFQGWWDGMFNSQYAGMGGVYENPLHWNADNFSKPYVKALKGDGPFIYQDPPSKARYLWSQQPAKGCIRPNDPKFTTLNFRPDEPEGLSGVTVLWQYATNCFKFGTQGLADMNLADARGYALMWARNTGPGILV